MNNVKTIFGKDVDLTDYERLHLTDAHDRQVNAKFIKFAWMDLTGRSVDDEDLQNLDIRDEQNDRNEELQNLKISISRGWDTSFFPPCYGTDGRYRDGRGRVLTAIEKNQQWMPVALYAYDDEELPLTNYLANGLTANDSHAAAQLSKMKDYESAGVRAILAGELKNDKANVDDFLYRVCRIERRFPGNVGGHITKIREAIIKRASEGVNGASIRRKDEKEWQQWIENSISRNALYWQQNYGVSEVSDIAFHKTGKQAAERILTRHILPNASNGKITNIVLYAGGTREDMIKDHVAFEQALQELYDNIYSWVNHEIHGIELKHEVDSPMWKIIGVIPQFLNDDEHETSYKRGYLISMNSIRVLHPMNNILPFAANG